MAIGAKGVISVAANIVPADVTSMVHAARDGEWEKAQELHYKLWPLCKALFLETNPIPVKTSMKILGLINGELRLPLCDAQAGTVEKLTKALQAYGLEVPVA